MVAVAAVTCRRGPPCEAAARLTTGRHGNRNAALQGFVANSFYSGLTPTEFFFHTMGGREGLVDTAVKTAETGYMQRRLMKALEDLSVRYDMTVRNSNDCVVQFQYGDDSLDPAAMEEGGQPVDFARLLDATLATPPTVAEPPLLPSAVVQLTLDELTLGRLRDYPERFRNAVRDCLLAYAERLAGARAPHGRPAQADAMATDDDTGCVDRATLLSHAQLLRFLELCARRYDAARLEAGTAIGAIGAQSIGEPGTQMTLKTFHFAGVASMNITLGVPRIKEIINARSVPRWRVAVALC